MFIIILLFIFKIDLHTGNKVELSVTWQIKNFPVWYWYWCIVVSADVIIKL